MDTDNNDMPESQLLSEDAMADDAEAATGRAETFNHLVTNRSENFFRDI
jgi:hypothetical protein